MAHFYGKVSGARGWASRLGGKARGLCVIAASWAGAVRVDLSYDNATRKDHYTVSLEPWQGSGPSRVLARGVLGEEAPVEQPCPLPAVPGVSSDLLETLQGIQAETNIGNARSTRADLPLIEAGRDRLRALNAELLTALELARVELDQWIGHQAADHKTFAAQGAVCDALAKAKEQRT